MHIIIGSGHPLYYTDATEITPKELEKYTVLSRDQVNAKDYARSAYLYSDVTIGKQTDLRVIITDQAALYEMLEFTDCYCAGFSSDVVYQNVPGPHNLRNLTIIDGKEPIMMNVAWIAPANMEFMPLVKEYIQLITDVCTRKDFWELHPELKLNMHENF